MNPFRGKRRFGLTGQYPPAVALGGGGFLEGRMPDWPQIQQMLTTPGGLFAATVLAVLVLLVIGFVWRLRKSLAEVRRASSLSTRLSEALSVSPDGYYLWDHVSGAERRSGRLDEMLGLRADGTPGFEPVRARVDPGYLGELDKALESLRNSGLSFDILLPVVAAADAGPRNFRVIGVRALGGDGKPLADLVWFRDISRFVAEFKRMTRDIENLAGNCVHLESLLNTLPVPAWVRGPDLNLIFCNEAYAKALEVPAETAVAENHEIAESVINNRGRALAERAQLTGVAQTESHHIVIGGKRRLLEFVEIPLRRGAEGIMAGYAIDFTDLEKVQNDLARELAAHGNVLEQLGTAIALFGADGKLKYFNTAYRVLWRLDEAWLLTGPDYGEVLEAQRERRRLPETVDFRAYKEERVRQFTSLIEPQEDLMHLPDGTTLRVKMFTHPFGGVLFTFDDVTDKLALERSYNTLIAVQRETLDNLYEGVAVIGGDGRLKLSNPAFAQIWNLSSEQLVGEPHIAELIEATRGFYGIEDEESWSSAKSELVSQVMARTPRSGRLERSDGSVLEYAAVPLPDGNLVLRYVEATDRYRVEQALRERNQALETASRLKSEFIANVSYELRTPLNTIIGFSEILKNEYFGELNARQKEYSEGILEASQALLMLINDIIDLATIEAGYMVLDLETVDVHAMLVSVLTLTRERARDHDINLVFECPPNIGTLYGDQRRLRQAMFNLISNSIKFTPPGGTITVSASREDGTFSLSVADTGIGVAVEDQAQVFEKFVRGHPPVGRHTGAGLGLSLVKSFIELHGGTVEMQSSPHAGTTVTLHLPSQAAEVKAASAGPA